MWYKKLTFLHIFSHFTHIYPCALTWYIDFILKTLKISHRDYRKIIKLNKQTNKKTLYLNGSKEVDSFLFVCWMLLSVCFKVPTIDSCNYWNIPANKGTKHLKFTLWRWKMNKESVRPYNWGYGDNNQGNKEGIRRGVGRGEEMHFAI